jgi:VanZ family protein|tara:strand:- start:955 stop:1305 length:351 start_codon:yes stop_codon:yes gene_type:complete
MKSKVYRVLLSFYIVLILSISAIPTNSILDLGFLHADKIAHFIEYSILGFLAVQSFNPLNRINLFCIIFSGFIFGVFDEWWQSFVSDRCTSIFDLLADNLGMLVSSIYFYKSPKHK